MGLYIVKCWVSNMLESDYTHVFADSPESAKTQANPHLIVFAWQRTCIRWSVELVNE